MGSSPGRRRRIVPSDIKEKSCLLGSFFCILMTSTLKIRRFFEYLIYNPLYFSRHPKCVSPLKFRIICFNKITLWVLLNSYDFRRKSNNNSVRRSRMWIDQIRNGPAGAECNEMWFLQFIRWNTFWIRHPPGSTRLLFLTRTSSGLLLFDLRCRSGIIHKKHLHGSTKFIGCISIKALEIKPGCPDAEVWEY